MSYDSDWELSNGGSISEQTRSYLSSHPSVYFDDVTGVTGAATSFDKSRQSIQAIATKEKSCQWFYESLFCNIFHLEI